MEFILDTHWTAQQEMENYPRVIDDFLFLRLDCVGCYLEQFYSLEEIAVSYELPLDV